ncbi:hypothetical protein FACS1894199_12260 [Bacteroidia bacterium]|nr:hypothetical protein FACS1894199_12260 [Bacteroidia bacterium]
MAIFDTRRSANIENILKNLEIEEDSKEKALWAIDTGIESGRAICNNT